VFFLDCVEEAVKTNAITLTAMHSNQFQSWVLHPKYYKEASLPKYIALKYIVLKAGNDFILNISGALSPKIVWRISPHTVKGFSVLLAP
jgi:hypothetical protein